MKSLKDIIVATDFTESSVNLLENAIQLAQVFKSRVTLIHVIPADLNEEKVLPLVKEAATDRLKEETEKVKAAGLETNPPILKVGDLSEEIVKSSNELAANLTVIGSGNSSSDDTVKLGSIASRVVRLSDKPVFVIKEGQTLDIKNIICPIDFSRESGRALNSAIELSRMFDAHLQVLSVYPYSKYNYRSFGSLQEAEMRQMQTEKEFKSFLEQFNLDGLNFEKKIEGGRPAEVILSRVKEKKADLLIMGTTGRTGIRKILIGSVTERVIMDVPCSFITLKHEDAFESAMTA